MPACHLSFFNYLILWAGIWLVAAMVFITFHRAKRIRFIQSSIFIVLIVITVGPLSVLNISELFGQTLGNDIFRHQRGNGERPNTALSWQISSCKGLYSPAAVRSLPWIQPVKK